ncbi:restriction endonuclease subunit S, partial [Mucilaginibacter phyllosphaerae]
LSKSTIEKIEVYIPKKDEQEKLMGLLSALDGRIQTQNKIIRELDVLKNVISQRIFSQELRFQDSNGCDFPAWETKKLKEVCDINPKIKSVPNSFYYIDLESVVNGRLLKEDRILKSEAPSRAQRVLAKNDILFQMVRPYQKNNLFFDKKGEYVASTGYAQIRTKQSSRFIYQYLHNRRFVDKVIERCTGTSYPAISSTDFGNIEIDCPSLSEQIKIGDFLASIDTKIDLENQLLKKIQDQKKHLLANLFI